MEAPFRLEAITLRGIGPYYDAARLELRPITVLCGKNGSGKSTWFKALDLIRRSLALPDFPFAWDVSSSHSVSDIETTNARLYLKGDPESPGDAGDAVPPGTIGLDLVTVANLALRLAYERHAEGNPLESMLWSGLIPRGTRLSLRFTRPQIASDDEPTRLHNEVRLIVDGQHHLWFHRPLGQTGEYRFESSGSFSRGGSSSDLAISPVSSFDPSAKSAEPRHDDWNKKACLNAVDLIGQVTAAATAGIFHLAAIRPLQQVRDVDSVRLEESDEARDKRRASERLSLETRYVGEDGSNALLLSRAFAYNRMIRTTAPGDAGPQPASRKPDDHSSIGYVFEGFVSQWMDKLLSVRIGQDSGARGPESRILDHIHEDAGPEPLGYLESGEACPVDPDVSSEPSALAVFRHRYFGWEQQPPGRFSAGFHQLFPIIAQVGLMQRHETFFLENPEVHLHPSLQVELTEFLMKQAGEGQGRIVVIETQSDLVIRRVLRAMLEEDSRFPERVARIYFCDRERIDDNFDQARIAPLALDELGRVKNWPEGFLDTSVNESGRLLRAMYGDFPREERDE